jgi:diaminopimelate decarboxylase
LEAAREIGYLPEKVEFTGPGKTRNEISYAVEYGVGSINVENIDELMLIVEICNTKKMKANVGLRINPRMKNPPSGLRMCGDTQFGIIEDDIEEAISIINSAQECIRFSGFHMHLGSQFMIADQVVANFRSILQKSIEISSLYEIEIRKINFGGGLGVDMFGKRDPLDLGILKKGLEELLKEFSESRILKNTRYIVEPGRFVVAESGIYAAQVLYKKHGYKRDYIIVDGGLHQHYAAAGGMGQAIRRNYEIDCICWDTSCQETKKYTIAGSLCLADDILGSEIELPATIRAGDILIFYNSGAYALTASPTRFISHPPPTEIVN